MPAFLVRGTVRMSREWTKFSKEVAAEDSERAVEIVLSDLGSKHRLPRRLIQVKDVTPVALEKIEDSVVRFKAGGSA
jgi:large subunit ribosomal protein LX